MTAILLAAIIARIEPTAGPALPFDALKHATLQSVRIGERWANGCKFVSFYYRTDLSVQEISDIFDQEKTAHFDAHDPRDGFLTLTRRANGVHQAISVRRRKTSYGISDANGSRSGVKVDPYVTISVTESPLQDRRISRWYWEAISEDPPVPMIDVPFLKGVETTGVSVTSFDYLMSSSGQIPFKNGKMVLDEDAYVYTAIVERSHEALKLQFESWAAENGYSNPEFHGAWFKPKARLFEIELRPYYSLDRELTQVTLFVSDRIALHPIARMKF